MSSDAKGAGSARPVDEVALRRTRERLERATEAPWLHGEVARRMADRLPMFKQRPQLVLDVWPGPGASEDALKAALPGARVARLRDETVREPSARWWSARRWLQSGATVDEASLPLGQYEMVWANMRLHHEADPLSRFRRWHQCLAVGGYLMFSTLGPGSLAGLRAVYRRAGWSAPMADLVDMHDLGDQLVAVGFADPVMDQETVRLTWDKPESAIRELRSLGSNTDPRRASGLRTPRWRHRLMEALIADAERTASGRIELEFELVFGHAFKASPGVKDGAQTRIALDEMRQSLRSARGRPSE